MNSSTSRFVVSLLVSDRTGILRDVAGALTDLGADIDGISQTVVEGYFTVILTAAFDRPVSVADIKAGLERGFSAGEAQIAVRPFERAAEAGPTVRGDRYVATIAGPRGKGVLKSVTSFLASKGINVEDWTVDFQGEDAMHIGEITVPAPLDIKQLQDDLEQQLTAMGLTGSIQHENIFRVTNEVGSVRPLILGKHRA